MNIERSFSNVIEESCTPLSDSRCDTESLHAASIVVLRPRHQECNSADVSAVAREISPSEGGRDGTSLNVGNNITGKKPKHSALGRNNTREVVRGNLLGEVFELRNSSPDVVRYMSSRIEPDMIDSNYGDPTVPDLRRHNVYLREKILASGGNY